MGLASSLTTWVAGRPLAIPGALLARYPELGEARWREGGLPLRIGGAFLGRNTVAGFALWRTVFVARGVPLHAELLLHELGHVRQFVRSGTFPLRYLWESARRGYEGNRFEHEAQAFAESRLRARHHHSPGV